MRQFSEQCMIVLLVLASGCASTGSDWKWASTQDSILAYENFLALHPTASQADSAAARITRLSVIVERGNAERIRQLKYYEAGKTTTEEFMQDGWNAKDPYYRKMGILDAKRDKPLSFSFEIGIYEALPLNSPISQRIRVTGADSVAMHEYNETGTSEHTDFGEMRDRYVALVLKMDVSRDVSFYSNEFIAKKRTLCFVEFEDGLLDRIVWTGWGKEMRGGGLE